MISRRILYAVLVAAAVLFQIFFRFYLSTFILVFILVLPVLSLLLSLPGLAGSRLEIRPAGPSEVVELARKVLLTVLWLFQIHPHPPVSCV